jgi:hypothetical protein
MLADRRGIRLLSVNIEPLPPPAQVRGDQPYAGTGGGCGVEKDGFEFLCLAAKTVGCTAKW